MTDTEQCLAAARRYAEAHGGLPAPSFKVVRRLYTNMAGLAEAAGVAYRPAPPRRATGRRPRVQGMTRERYINHHLSALLEVAAGR